VDVWDDEATLQWLQHHEHKPTTAAHERKRAERRATYYEWQGTTLRRKMADGTTRIVPSPADRLRITTEVHNHCGHFGEKRTASLLQTGHWWRGLTNDVHEVVRHCSLCDRVNKSFNMAQPELRSLPIRGLFYRWGVDLFGPLPRTRRGNTYCCVMIEHFSKHVEAYCLPCKEAEHTRAALLSCVIGRYGACAEIVTNQGTEFAGAFHDLCETCMIDHRTTAPGHPQADGATERAVQIMKRALKKLCEQAQRADTWDEQLPWILLGYNCSVQSSTKFSPYELLHAQKPTIPPAVIQRLSPDLPMDNVEAAAASLLVRAEALTRNCAMAGHNLLIAQQRQSLHYARRRGGTYTPALRRFQPGDFVYVRHISSNSTLQIHARPEIFRVVELRPSGAVVLQGKCGRTFTNNVANCTPCHLPGIDPTIDVTLARPDEWFQCEVCAQGHDAAKLLLCDSCGTGWHTYCLSPPLGRKPPTAWICPRCTQMGVDLEAIQAR
jgi:hypothetical protein